MIEPTKEQIDSAKRLGVSLHFVDSPLTIARLVEVIEDLQRRMEILELKRWPLRK
jgi:hypothetical protein